MMYVWHVLKNAKLNWAKHRARRRAFYHTLGTSSLGDLIIN